MKPTLTLALLLAPLAALHAADLDIARNWKPGSLKDDGKRSGTEKGFRE